MARATLVATVGTCHGQTLPRVEILPVTSGTNTAPGRSITTLDATSPDWLASADWRGLASEVPGLTVRVGDGGLSTSYSLRGHGLTRTLLDGLPDVMRLFVRDPATVHSVEVLRGSAGVDQGIGSPGGMLAMTTPQPSPNQARRIDLQMGRDDWRRLVLDLDQPIAPDWLSRLVLASQDGRSEPGNLTQRRDHLLGTLAWLPGRRPADGGVRLVAERQISRSPYAFGTVLAPDGLIRYGELYASPWQDSWRGVSQVATHAWLAWQATPDQRVSLRADIADARGHRDETLIGSWDQRSDGDLNGYYTHVLDNHRQRSARLESRWQMESPSQRHDTRIGLDRLHRQWLLTGVQNLRGFVIDAQAPDFSDVDPATLTMSARHRHQRLDESGRYLRHRIDWPGDLSVAAGLRQTGYTEGNAPLSMPMSTVHDMDARTHELSLGRAWPAGWLTSLNWAEGVEPNTGVSRTGAWLAPQESRLVELGLRQDPPLPGSVGWSLALYRIRLEGLTRSDPVDRTYVVADGARQVTGLEVIAPWRLGAWTVSTHIQATRPRWLQATSASVGKLPVNTPARTASTRIERRFDAGPFWQDARFWLTWQGRSSLYADSANRRRIAGTGIVDIGMHGRLGPWQSTLVLRNVLDRDHVASVSSVDEVYQGPMRHWRFTLGTRW